MNRLPAIFSAIAVLGIAGGAAADQTQGTITEMDHFNRITLSNGMIFKLGTNARGVTSFRSVVLHEGDRVMVRWEGYEQGYMLADSVKVLQRK